MAAAVAALHDVVGQPAAITLAIRPIPDILGLGGPLSQTNLTRYHCFPRNLLGQLLNQVLCVSRAGAALQLGHLGCGTLAELNADQYALPSAYRGSHGLQAVHALPEARS